MSDAPNSPTPPEPAVPAVPVVPGSELPPENLNRGTVFALAALPAGVIVWGIISALGYVSGWVALGVALFALWLYRKGSGGRISFAGAIRVTIVHLVTLIVAFIVGIVIANPVRFNQAASRGTIMQLFAADPLYLIFPVVFGILGVVLIFRTAAQARTQQPPA